MRKYTLTKLSLKLALGIGLLSACPLRALDATSPDGQWMITKHGPTLEIKTSGGQPALLISRTLGAFNDARAVWSPDGNRVAVALCAARGSLIIGAWREGQTWHRALQLDAAPQLRALETEYGRLIAERRTLGNWDDERTLIVRGTLTFSSGQSVRYRYRLVFTGRSSGLSRAGYETGALRGEGCEIEGNQ